MKKILTIAFISAFLLSGCVSDKLSKGVVKVNGNVITQAEFDRAVNKNIDNSFYKMFGGSKNFIKKDSNPAFLSIKEQTIQELISKSLLDAEIKKRGIKVSDADVANERKLIIDKVGSKEQLDAIIKQRGISNDDFLEDLKTQIKMKKLVDSIEKVNVSESETKKYYDTHKDEFKHPEMVKASHILISADTLEIIKDLRAKNKNLSTTELNKKVEEIIAAKEAKANEVLKRVQANPADFEKIAMAESEDQGSKERGGQLGFFAKEQMVPEFSKAAFSMKPNTVSGIVKSPYGYHIIKVTDRIEAGIRPYEKIKDELKFVLETQKQVKIISNLLDGLRKSAEIKYLDPSFDSQEIVKRLNQAIEENNKKLKENNANGEENK